MPQIVSCPICQNNDLKPHSMRYREGYPHLSRVLCKTCGAVFANPMATAGELSIFYNKYYDKGNFKEKEYKKSHIALAERMKSASHSDNKVELGRFVKYHRLPPHDGGRYLDVGCGLGRALLFASRLGYDIYGTELDGDACDFCRQQYPGSNITEGDLLRAQFPGDHFNYILFYHVIEHVTDPRAYVREIHRILKPGGKVFIGTPNIACFSYRLYRAFMFLMGRIPSIIDGVDHTVVFSKKTLAGLVKSEGFKIIEHRTEGMTESLQTIFTSKVSTLKKAVRIAQKIVRVNQAIVCIKEVR